jgi:hypothetical protein
MLHGAGYLAAWLCGRSSVALTYAGATGRCRIYCRCGQNVNGTQWVALLDLDAAPAVRLGAVSSLE